MSEHDPILLKKIRVTGVVQGVGFRAFVYQLAHSHDLAGWVCNTSAGVDIEVEGRPQHWCSSSVISKRRHRPWPILKA